MKKILILATIITFGVISSGCATWDGIKTDSKNAYDSTKEAIHEATE
jgi:uncharacterized protein YxeA